MFAGPCQPLRRETSQRTSPVTSIRGKEGETGLRTSTVTSIRGKEGETGLRTSPVTSIRGEEGETGLRTSPVTSMVLEGFLRNQDGSKTVLRWTQKQKCWFFFGFKGFFETPRWLQDASKTVLRWTKKQKCLFFLGFRSPFYGFIGF